MVELSKRMLMNVSMIPKGYSVADIGCDHGWVSIYLAINNIASNVIAMDVADGPLMMAKSHIEEAGLSGRITVKKSDGLKELEVDEEGIPEAQAVLIAGMGGHLAIRLLEQSIDKCLKLGCIVLQIQSDIEFVRKRTAELGFIIDDEEMVFDEGKYYTAMRIIPYLADEKVEYSEAELKYGPVLLRKRADIFLQYLEYKKTAYEKIISNINANSSQTDSEQRASDIAAEIKLINDCIAGE